MLQNAPSSPLIGQGLPPTTSAYSAAGTSPTLFVSTFEPLTNANAFSISLQPGPTNTGGAQFRILFAQNTVNNFPSIVASPANNNAAGISFWFSGQGFDGVDFSVASVLSPGTLYVWNFHVLG